MTTHDLAPAASVLAGLVAAVPDDLLDGPTPCPAYTVGDLVDHVGGLAVAFTAAAAKDVGGPAAGGPSGDRPRLRDGWRDRIAADLDRMAAAWRDRDAWTGTTQAGGVELPGAVAGLVALDELVVHGWDLARATGRPFEPDRASLEAVHAFVATFAGPGQEAAREGLFGPVVPVADDAPLLDRVVGMTGRDPAWRPPG